jgi:hypothetical protein
MRNLPIDALVIAIVEWCTRQHAETLEGIRTAKQTAMFVAYAIDIVKKNSADAVLLEVKRGTDYSIVVEPSRTAMLKWTVKMDQNIDGIVSPTCSCLFMSDTGLPCKRICALSISMDLEAKDFISPIYSMATYKEAYTIDSGLNPLPINLEDIEEDEKIETPIVKVPKGRPKSQRIKAPIEIGYSSQLSSQGIPKRPVKCSQCQQIGYNKATCKNLIASPSLGVPIDIGD